MAHSSATQPTSSNSPLSISGPAITALLHRSSSSPADADGLLFGHVTPFPSLSIHVTGHGSLSSPSSLSSPLGHVALPSSTSPPPDRRVIGLFSSRRWAPLRPSMRDLASSLSLSKTLEKSKSTPESTRSTAKTLVFLLITTSTSPTLANHTYLYKAYLLDATSAKLTPTSLSIINAGPGFRDQYGSFIARSPMPEMEIEKKKADQTANSESIGVRKRIARDQGVLDHLAEGFRVERLERMTGGAGDMGSEMEELYRGMLRRMEALARQVEKGSAKVLEQVMTLITSFLSSWGVSFFDW